VLLKLLGVTQVMDSDRAHSPEELRLLVMQTRRHGLLNESDTQMLAGVFDFHQKKARDVMRPRTEIVAIPATATQEEVWAVVRQERYSRYPVYGEDLDDLVGVFLAKDLWLYAGEQPFTVQQFVREALYIPDTRAAERVLDDLRKTRAHMAIVLDEFGGTAGIVTMVVSVSASARVVAPPPSKVPDSLSGSCVRRSPSECVLPSGESSV